MRTPTETLDFVTALLINDLNMLTVKLNRGIARTMDDTDKILLVIEITFKDISKSNWFNALDTELRGFLQGQDFLITGGGENTLVIIFV